MDIVDAQQGQVSGNVLFYTRPEPISPETHGALGMNFSDTPFGFARSAHAVPLSVTEFGPASLSFPIIFGGPEKQPLAIMSIRQNENLFISPEGAFEDNQYIPAFIRRYPFVLANDPSNDRLVVCVDRGAPFLAVGGAVPLFEKGQPTEYTTNAIDFCSKFEGERQQTEVFVKDLLALDLFELKQLNFTPKNADGSEGEMMKLSEYFAVDEEKLKALPMDKLQPLRDSGALQQIYLHINSLFNWEKLLNRTLAQQVADEQAAANAVKN